MLTLVERWRGPFIPRGPAGSTFSPHSWALTSWAWKSPPGWAVPAERGSGQVEVWTEDPQKLPASRAAASGSSPVSEEPPVSHLDTSCHARRHPSSSSSCSGRALGSPSSGCCPSLAGVDEELFVPLELGRVRTFPCRTWRCRGLGADPWGSPEKA